MLEVTRNYRLLSPTSVFSSYFKTHGQAQGAGLVRLKALTWSLNEMTTWNKRNNIEGKFAFCCSGPQRHKIDFTIHSVVEKSLWCR